MFEQFKQEAEKKQPALQLVNLKQIDIGEELFTQSVIKVNGNLISVDDAFVTKLLKVLNLSPKIKKNLEESSQNKRAFGEVVNKVKKAVDESGNIQVYLVANPQSKKIVNIVLPEKFKRITNESLVNIVEDVCDRYNLEISNYNFDADGSASINLKAGKEVDLGVNTGDIEMFKFGLTFHQRPETTDMNEFALRMVCTNGMFSDSGLSGSGTMFRFGNNNGFGNLLSTLNTMNRNSFIPQGFANRVEKASKHTASLKELEDTLHTINSSIDMSAIEPTLQETYYHYVSQNYLPELDSIYNRLRAQNRFPEFMQDGEKKAIMSGMPIWQLVNNMTHFASNQPIQINEKRREQIQKKAGDFLVSDWDYEIHNSALSEI
jgi:hypothetical protein